MQHIDTKVRSDSKLQISSICSIRIRSRKWDISAYFQPQSKKNHYLAFVESSLTLARATHCDIDHRLPGPGVVSIVPCLKQSLLEQERQANYHRVSSYCDWRSGYVDDGSHQQSWPWFYFLTIIFKISNSYLAISFLLWQVKIGAICIIKYISWNRSSRSTTRWPGIAIWCFLLVLLRLLSVRVWWPLSLSDVESFELSRNIFFL